MTTIEAVLVQDASFTRFRIAIRVMQEILSAGPEPVGAGDLERLAHCSAGMLARVCANLARVGILAPAHGIKGGWIPGPAANRVTLADILCCEIEHRLDQQDPPSPAGATSSGRHEVEAFLLQATMNVNQIVLSRLRQFPLARSGGRNAETTCAA
jgi:DNA-binding IscR family transcriptional regulator